MCNYLYEKCEFLGKIRRNLVLVENKSMNTVENALFVYQKLHLLHNQFNDPNQKSYELIIVTSDFHCKRAGLIFEKTALKI